MGISSLASDPDHPAREQPLSATVELGARFQRKRLLEGPQGCLCPHASSSRGYQATANRRIRTIPTSSFSIGCGKWWRSRSRWLRVPCRHADGSDLGAAPHGGARYPMEVRLDTRTFATFHLDVGVGDVVATPSEWPSGQELLGAHCTAGLPGSRT